MSITVIGAIVKDTAMAKKSGQGTFGANWSINAVTSALIRANPDWVDVWEPATLKAGTELAIPGRKPQEIYFPFEGYATAMASICAVGEEGPGTEVMVGMYGSNDLLNVWALFGENPCPYRLVVHAGGAGLKASAQAARRLVSGCPRSRAVIDRYMQGILMETYQTLACSLRFTSEERVAACLVQMSEVLVTDALPVTHRYLGDMLGVRRATVTLAVQELEKLELVDSSSSRGRINVTNMPGLLRKAGQCWDNMRAHRAKLNAEL